MLPLILLLCVLIVIVILYAYFIKYLIWLEKTGCECSANWRRDYIKYYFVFLLILMGITLLFQPLKIMKYFAPIIFVINIVFIVIIYQYIHELKEKKCNCSVATARDALEIFNYLQMFLLAISLLQVVFGTIALSEISNKSTAVATTAVKAASNVRRRTIAKK